MLRDPDINLRFVLLWAVVAFIVTCVLVSLSTLSDTSGGLVLLGSLVAFIVLCVLASLILKELHRHH